MKIMKPRSHRRTSMAAVGWVTFAAVSGKKQDAPTDPMGG
jgi:hypothetical protein